MDFLRKIILGLAGIFIVGVAALAVVFIYKQLIYFPRAIEKSGSNTLTVDFVIEKGESVKSIARRLEEIGVVGNDWVLVNYLAKKNLDKKVEAGHFRFSGGETIPDVVLILQTGEATQISLTILEGWNSFEIDAKLAELGLIQPNDFALFVRDPSMDSTSSPQASSGQEGSDVGNEEGSFVVDRPVASLEGYIFPATYKIDPRNFSVDDLVSRMLQATERNLREAGWSPETSNIPLHDALTIASIVELEESSDENRPKVADILWRRLEAEMGLYADATLFYTLGHRENLTAEDLQIDSPYNTRKYKGLPPTPICSPSLSSIRAALHPELNDFWYYLHDSDGQIHFAKTLMEHNENKAEFIKSN
ncbi:MAG: endolytic transglycosylase MltG [Patescibacteria group bacterium]